MLRAGNVIIVGTGVPPVWPFEAFVHALQPNVVAIHNLSAHPVTPTSVVLADPSNHAATQPQSGTPTNSQNLIRNAIAYATAGNTTGAYVCLSQVRACVHLPAMQQAYLVSRADDTFASAG